MARRLQRHALKKPLEIVDQISQQPLGALVNINVEGLMIMGNTPIEDNHLYQIRIQLPKTIRGVESIDIGVDCLWNRSDEQYDRHWAGFQIIDASEQSIEVIEALIDDYAQLVPH